MSFKKLGIPFLSFFLGFSLASCTAQSPVITEKEPVKQEEITRPSEKTEANKNVVPEQVMNLPVNPQDTAKDTEQPVIPVPSVTAPVTSSGSSPSGGSSGGNSGIQSTTGTVTVNVDLGKPSQQTTGTVKVNINQEKPVSGQ